MWLMAACTFCVTGSYRMEIDAARTGQRRVATHTTLIGSKLRLVGLVAIEAAAQSSMASLCVAMALRARNGLQRRYRVWMMTIAAVLIRVCAHRTMAPLIANVARHARGSRVENGAFAKTMAILTARPSLPVVQRRHHRGVATLAQVSGRFIESGFTVACSAFDLADMGGVTGCASDNAIRCRNLLRGSLGC